MGYCLVEHSMGRKVFLSRTVVYDRELFALAHKTLTFVSSRVRDRISFFDPITR